MTEQQPKVHVVMPPALAGGDGCTSSEIVNLVTSRAEALAQAGEGDTIADVGASTLLQGLGTAAAMIGTDGSVLWSDERFDALPPTVQAACREKIANRRSPRVRFELEDRLWELHVAGLSCDGVGVLLVDASLAGERIRRRASIDAAGMSLLRLDRRAIAELSVADRLKQLECSIREAVQANLQFDHFEIRLLSPDSNRLELVISEALSPMRIGEVLYAKETDNGISGWVAATGRPYLCRNVRTDPLYREGLDEAQCSLTVPLKVSDRVIGVFNIECDAADALDELDLEMAVRFGEYVASVLHLLDLLVVERITTSEQTARRLSEALDPALGTLEALAEGLEPDAQAALKSALESIRSGIEQCASGPRSVIDAEQELRVLKTEPALAGRMVVVVEDEPRIRDEVARILRQLGCRVSSFAGGEAFFSRLERGLKPDLVISDIRLGDASGYEVLTAARDACDDVPVLLMTGFGYDPNHTIVRASAEGVQGVLLKPFRVGQLVDAVNGALGVEVS
ncbi:MAG: response regulator [Phycisphaerales bacterium]|nr:response regulator [Phycisphaerales bacterium]